jgi:phage shock protein C
MASDKKLVRNLNNKVLAGVCSGTADYFDMDPMIVRIIMVILGLWGPGIIIYIVLLLLMQSNEKQA